MPGLCSFHADMHVLSYVYQDVATHGAAQMLHADRPMCITVAVTEATCGAGECAGHAGAA